MVNPASILALVGITLPTALTSLPATSSSEATSLVSRNYLSCDGHAPGDILCSSDGTMFGICPQAGPAIAQSLALGDPRCGAPRSPTSYQTTFHTTVTPIVYITSTSGVTIVTKSASVPVVTSTSVVTKEVPPKTSTVVEIKGGGTVTAPFTISVVTRSACQGDLGCRVSTYTTTLSK